MRPSRRPTRALPSSGALVCVLAFVVAFAPIWAPSAARAQTDVIRGKIAALRSTIAGASGPLAYVALRKLWAEWDEADPDEIEEALRESAVDVREPAPIRVYAALLEAYARRRRGDLDGARTRIARLGFVDRWMMLGPFDNDGKAGLAASYEPESEETQEMNPARDYAGKDHRPVRWRLLPAVSPYGWVDFGAFLRPAENSCVYAATFVRDARLREGESRPVSVWTGSTGALRVWWNGSRVFEDGKYRDLDSDRFALGLTLRRGWNRLTAKVCGDDRAPMLSLRVAAGDGAPDERLDVDADPIHSTAHGGAVAPAGRPERLQPGAVEGPVQAFERLVAGGDAAVLEAYAWYLAKTGADDPTEHRARELARKAADEAPTVPRLLLAGEVDESRNQRVGWIERAEALVAAGRASDEQAIEALVARANYVRSGVNPRDAAPYYDRVLDLDPDRVPAVLAKAELLEDAGLHETALALLGRALARRPRTVGLLRAMVAALREEGREAEADETADRYSTLRFDDPALLRARIDLAVARRDQASVSQWIDRLVAVDPDSTASFQTAAEAWMRLGDRVRAVAAYRAALEIAPDDTAVLRQLATLHGFEGERDEQIRLLGRVLALTPQAKDVREELAHLGPPAARPDERFARPPSEFLASRHRDAEGRARRTLVDLQVTTVFPNGLASRFHQIVFQPLTEAAAAQSREYEFTYETDSQTVQLRAARVYRSDGRVDDAVDSGAGGLSEDPDLAIYTTTRSYYVRFPQLEPGDVVELCYRVEDVAPRNAFADYFGEVVYLQGAEPIDRAEYVLLTPKRRTFYFNEPRVPGLVRSVEERGDERVFDFTALHVQPVEHEALQPPWAEVLGHVNVSTYRSWSDMGRWYWGLVKDQFVPDDEVRRRAEGLTAGLKDESAKVRAIYDYVVQKTRYVALEFGIHGYKPYRCAQIFARGFGDCKDKATLIVTMLSALGIKAIPVIVRTANKGDIEAAPASLAPFDHMIAFVPSLGLYLDGTAEYAGSLELPAMDRGAMALRVDQGSVELVHLPDPPASASVDSHEISATLGADGGAQIDWKAEVSGVDASEWRVRFHADATRKQRVQQMLASILPGSEVSAVDTDDLEDLERQVTMHVRGRVPQFATLEGNTMTIPLGRREHMVRNFASLASRRLDVRLLAKFTDEDDWTVHLPAGAKILSLPTPTRSVSPFGSYELDVDASGGVVHAKTVVTLFKTRVAAGEYPAFRVWCEKVDRALGQRATVEPK